ncbi:hypothetical protein BC01_178 [Bacillus phage BC01]|nr:hypothetical protein BC01_178 [Bacillus phage BC01]
MNPTDRLSSLPSSSSTSTVGTPPMSCFAASRGSLKASMALNLTPSRSKNSCTASHGLQPSFSNLITFIDVLLHKFCKFFLLGLSWIPLEFVFG